ncbi:hypothetical protein GCM10025869_18530 [Homoserinibacter gongjuensis]|uniref:Uncharacterized protein n=1 Tax=Homoserinibacter gongjuensis TaxID=1162968 RepID=A0ABQ6JW45_9MICO|nr:hypothetical protein GCM10025869_18530 [Homoserinibacter gongjuensis]
MEERDVARVARQARGGVELDIGGEARPEPRAEHLGDLRPADALETQFEQRDRDLAMGEQSFDDVPQVLGEELARGGSPARSSTNCWVGASRSPMRSTRP